MNAKSRAYSRLETDDEYRTRVGHALEGWLQVSNLTPWYLREYAKSLGPLIHSRATAGMIRRDAGFDPAPDQLKAMQDAIDTICPPRRFVWVYG